MAQRLNKKSGKLGSKLWKGKGGYYTSSGSWISDQEITQTIIANKRSMLCLNCITLHKLNQLERLDCGAVRCPNCKEKPSRIVCAKNFKALTRKSLEKECQK